MRGDQVRGFYVSSLLFPLLFFPSSAFLLSGSSGAPSAKLSPTCAVERAAAPEAERGSPCPVGTNAACDFTVRKVDITSLLLSIRAPFE